MKDQPETGGQKKSTKLRNLTHKTEAFDLLHPKGMVVCYNYFTFVTCLFNNYLMIFY